MKHVYQHGNGWRAQVFSKQRQYKGPLRATAAEASHDIEKLKTRAKAGESHSAEQQLW